jgi:hypothetical protein
MSAAEKLDAVEDDGMSREQFLTLYFIYGQFARVSEVAAKEALEAWDKINNDATTTQAEKNYRLQFVAANAGKSVALHTLMTQSHKSYATYRKLIG